MRLRKSDHRVTQPGTPCADEVITRLSTSATKGLDAGEVASRLQKYGPNRLPEGAKRGPFIRFLSQFNNILVYVLLGAGFTKLMLNLWLDATIIFGVVVLNALLGFIQEGRADDSIRNMLSAEARTVRGGETRMIAADQLLPGDLVPLESGDKVPADLRLTEVNNFRPSVTANAWHSPERWSCPAARQGGTGSSTTDRKICSTDSRGACPRSLSAAAAAAPKDQRNLAALTKRAVVTRAREAAPIPASSASRPTCLTCSGRLGGAAAAGRRRHFFFAELLFADSKRPAVGDCVVGHAFPPTTRCAQRFAGYGFNHLTKNESAKKELAKKGMPLERD
jgi:hypothetical protein